MMNEYPTRGSLSAIRYRLRLDKESEMIYDLKFVLASDYQKLHDKYESTVRILSETESYVAKLEAQLRERT